MDRSARSPRQQANARAAKRSLREKLGRRAETGGYDAEFNSESTVAELAEAWLKEVRSRPDLAEGTKDLYRREMNSLDRIKQSKRPTVPINAHSRGASSVPRMPAV